MNNETQVSIKFTNSVTGQKKLEQYAETLKKINTFFNSIDSSKAKEIDKFAKDTSNTNKNLNDTSKEIKNLSNNIETALNVQAFTQLTKTIERFATSLSKFTKKSADYLENWNLLDVAFQNNTIEAERFTNTLSEMYGLDESWGYRTIGIFKQLSNAMGLSDEVGTKLAKTLTQLAIDTSSLYNIDVKDTVSILQSGLAGQTKPVRRLGGDITQTTLQTTLDSAGIDRMINQLSYAEKRLVIVASLLNQTSEASGDWGRTLESVANQMRIFQQQTERLTRSIGNLFLPTLQIVLPYLNAMLMVLTEIIDWLALLVGYNPDDFDYFKGIDESVIDLKEHLDGAVGSTQKLQSGLRSFDKLNNLKTPTASGGGAGSGYGGLDPDVLELFNRASDNYLNNIDKVEMKATKIRDMIMEWLGFTKKVNLETGDVSFKFDHLTSGTVLGALVVGGTIYSGISKIYSLLKKIGILDFSSISKILNQIKKGTLLTTIVAKFKTLLPIVTKLGVALGGIASVVFGSKGTHNAMKKMTEQAQIGTKEYKKYTESVLATVAGGALIGSVIPGVGTLIGALAGTVVAGASAWNGYKDAIESMAKGQIFGSLSISAEQWYEMLKNIDTNLPNYGEKYAEFQAQMESLGSAFQSNYESLELYGYKFGVVGQKISEEDTVKIIDSIANMCDSTREMIDNNTDIFLSVWGDSFSRMSTLTKEEQKDVLTSIINYGAKQKQELEKAQNNITTTYDNAIKTRGYLTDEEYNYISEQLAKIRALTQNEMSKSHTDALYLQKQFASDYSKLNEESYATFEQALTQWKENEYNKISEAYNTRINLAENAYKDQAISEEKYNKLVADADKTRLEDSTRIDNEIAKARDNVYQSMIAKYQEVKNENDKTSKEIKNQIESIFKKFNLDTNALNNSFYQAGLQAKNSFSNALGSGGGFSIPIVGKASFHGGGLGGSIGHFANGGLPPVGQLFVANEQGPELVGHIGGQSFVANQNQMMDLLDRKINSTQNSNQVFNIYLDENHQLGSYTLDQLKDMAKSNGEPLTIG